MNTALWIVAYHFDELTWHLYRTDSANQTLVSVEQLDLGEGVFSIDEIEGSLILSNGERFWIY